MSVFPIMRSKLSRQRMGLLARQIELVSSARRRLQAAYYTSCIMLLLRGRITTTDERKAEGGMHGVCASSQSTARRREINALLYYTAVTFILFSLFFDVHKLGYFLVFYPELIYCARKKSRA